MRAKQLIEHLQEIAVTKSLVNTNEIQEYQRLRNKGLELEIFELVVILNRIIKRLEQELADYDDNINAYINSK